jgi:hypothetical protein
MMRSNIPAFAVHQDYQARHSDMLATARTGKALCAADIKDKRTQKRVVSATLIIRNERPDWSVVSDSAAPPVGQAHHELLARLNEMIAEKKAQVIERIRRLPRWDESAIKYEWGRFYSSIEPIEQQRQHVLQQLVGIKAHQMPPPLFISWDLAYQQKNGQP